MPSVIIAILVPVIFLTSLLSGVFGMAGGLILMVFLLGVLPVASAMTLHASIQLVSNAWRCFLWRRHIVWHVLPWYGVGIVIGFTLMLLLHYVPDKAFVFIMMGSLPLLSIAGEKFIRLTVTNRLHAVVAATLLTFVQMTAGVVGPLLDLIYVNAPLTRQQIISTKAFSQSVMHMVRLSYFGLFIPMLAGVGGGVGGWPAGLSPWFMLVFLAASIAGTSAAAFFVHRLSDRNFKGLSRILIMIISIYCVGRGISLLLA